MIEWYWLFFALIASLLLMLVLPMVVENTVRAFVRGWMDEREAVLRRLYHNRVEERENGEV